MALVVLILVIVDLEYHCPVSRFSRLNHECIQSYIHVMDFVFPLQSTVHITLTLWYIHVGLLH